MYFYLFLTHYYEGIDGIAFKTLDLQITILKRMYWYVTAHENIMDCAKKLLSTR